jgi:hypothetical protein
MVDFSQPVGVGCPDHPPRDAREKMADKTFIIRFKRKELRPLAVTAQHAEFHGDHLVLLTSSGKLAALLLADVIESWAEIDKL